MSSCVAKNYDDHSIASQKSFEWPQQLLDCSYSNDLLGMFNKTVFFINLINFANGLGFYNSLFYE